MKTGYERIGHTVSVEVAKKSCLDKKHYVSRTVARDQAAWRPTAAPLPMHAVLGFPSDEFEAWKAAGQRGR